jgi:hypothetical protein
LGIFFGVCTELDRVQVALTGEVSQTLYPIKLIKRVEAEGDREGRKTLEVPYKSYIQTRL